MGRDARPEWEHAGRACCAVGFAVTSACTGKSRVDVGTVNDARSSQNQGVGNGQTVVDISIRHADSEEALQPRLLVHREQLGASLDTVQTSAVHVERCQGDFASQPGLFDPGRRRVGVGR